MNPKAAALYNRLGVVLAIRLKRHDEALVHLRKAIELEPGSIVYMNNFSKVTGMLESALELRNESAEAHYLMGLCLQDARKPEDAIASLERSVALAPAMLQLNYLVDRSAVNLAERKGPSTPMACMLCSGIAATEVLKILTGRGKVWSAPHAIQFDAYRNRLARTWRPGGNANPLQRLAIAIARRQLLKRR